MIEKIIDIMFMRREVIVAENYEAAAAVAAMLVDVFGDSTTYRMHTSWRQKDGRFVFEVELPKKFQGRYDIIFKDNDIKEIGAA